MSVSQSSNKQIAKNAIALYFRMILTMLVGLYTSRIILQALGVEDFGIYNVVGGFVAMFSMISGSMSASISRYLTFELGHGDAKKLKDVFSTSIFVLIGLSIIVVIAVETFGLWYLNNKMVIPAVRMDAAFWVFQISLCSFVIRLINVPYNASIISHERMDVYAYLSILEVICKLLICYAVMISPIDKLVFYAILYFCIDLINQIAYMVFCSKKFEETRLTWKFDKRLFREMFSFAGWNFIGSSASILRTQGANLLLNWAGGPVVNAANGIANTVSGVVAQFVGNFTQAFNPQITKRYAAKEYESLMNLLICGSKFSFYLMFMLALPVMLNTDFILGKWLTVVPDHTTAFVRLMLVYLLTDALSRPIITAKNATGNIRNYQLVVGGILLLMLPLSYIGLELGMPVEIVAVSNVVTAVLALGARMFMLRGEFPFWSSRVFIQKVILNAIVVAVFASVVPVIVYVTTPIGWTNFILTTFASLVFSILSVFYIGCSATDRQIVRNKLVLGISTIKNKLHL